MLPTLRDYQARAIDSARTALAHGARSVLLVAPTGAGKTVIATHIAHGHVARGGTVLAIAPRLELVSQLRRALGSAARVETVQGLAASGERPAASLIIADEAHHYAADEWGAVAQHYRERAIVVGLTATPERADGRPLGDLFAVLVPVASVRELTDAGHLVPCHVYAPPARQSGLAMHPHEAVAQYADGRACIVFARDLAHAASIAESIPGSLVVSSELRPSDRIARLAAFASGSCSVLVNCQVLTEGYDCPRVEVVVLARGCSHAGTYLQIVGRALRPAPRKTHATLVDLVGAVHEHGLPDEPRAWSLDGNPCGVARSEAEAVRQCPACGLVALAAQWGPRTCPRCGHKDKGREDPKIRRAELQAIAERMPETERLAYLQRMRETAAARGYNPRWADVRYRVRFGAWP